MRAGLSGEIIAAVETKEMIEIIAGRGGLISEELERYEECIKRVRSGIAERMLM